MLNEPTPTPSSTLEAPPPSHDYAGAPRTSHFRWFILGMVFFGITINTIDRMVLGILAPDLQKAYHISEQAYGYIGFAFAWSYALGQSAAGAWLDRIGTRLGYALALAAWSVVSGLHALARGAWSFGIMRGLLGVSESPAFPAATKTLAEWFPKRERALAFGVVNSGTNIGAVLAPLIVPWLAYNYGWQWAFIGTASLGTLWLMFWIPFYRRPHEHPRVSPAELAHINSDPPDLPATKLPWATLLRHRQTWAFALGKFMTDPIWWFYMNWLAKFFKEHHGLNLSKVGLPMITVFLMADVGAIAGGWISSAMINRGLSINRARKTGLILCAICVTPIVFAAQVQSLWAAAFLLGLGTAGHQGFSSNLYTLVSDMFPRRAVGSVAGLGGTFGYCGASLFSIFIGWILTRNADNYYILFIMAGSAYLIAFTAIHLLAPKLQPALLEEQK